MVLGKYSSCASSESEPLPAEALSALTFGSVAAELAELAALAALAASAAPSAAALVAAAFDAPVVDVRLSLRALVGEARSD